MTKLNEELGIVPPINQPHLFGYDEHFHSFIELYKKNKLPNIILLSGPKGLGKSTFSYHFINYVLSINEANNYSIKDFCINKDNKSYKNLCAGIHPNFFLIENLDQTENIKIELIRNVLKFLNKTTYSSDIKIVLIDNAEFLNLNSSNALLKVLEEPTKNTFFFIVHNSNYKILNTIKSRCIQFNFFFSLEKKKKILNNLIKQYEYDSILDKIDENFYFETPGNILRYITLLNKNSDLPKDNLSIISQFIDFYLATKDPQILSFISSMIELFYNNLSMKKKSNLNSYFFNKINLVSQINDAKRFNLDKKNLFISIRETLKNEV